MLGLGRDIIKLTIYTAFFFNCLMGPVRFGPVSGSKPKPNRTC
jgi:hypothetical protein